MDSMYVYSEPGEKVQVGSVVAETNKKTRDNRVTLTSNYTDSYNLTYNGNLETKTLTRAPVPHKLIITKVGYDTQGRSVINFELN
jgi:hypothetical protein